MCLIDKNSGRLFSVSRLSVRAIICLLLVGAQWTRSFSILSGGIKLANDIERISIINAPMCTTILRDRLNAICTSPLEISDGVWANATSLSHDNSMRHKYVISSEKRVLRNPKPKQTGKVTTYNARSRLLEAAEKSRRVAVTTSILSKIHSTDRFNVIHCNRLIKHLANSGNFNQCDEVLEFMKTFNISANIQTFGILISRAGTWKHVNLAEVYFMNMKQYGFQPDLIIYNSLINAYVKSNLMNKAVPILQQMSASNITPDVITYNSLIDGYARNNQVGNVQNILSLMKQSGLKPNINTYSSIILTICENGDTESAFEMLEYMESENVEPSSVSYSIIIHALGRRGQIDKALEVINMMKAKNIPTNVVTLSSIVDACGKARRLDLALDIYVNMLKSEDTSIRPNSYTISSLLCACIQAGAIDSAIRVIADTKSCGLKLTTAMYTTLLSELNRMNLLDQVNLDGLY